MKLSELIVEYGDDKVQFQALDKCASQIDFNHKKGVTIKVHTDQRIGMNGMEKFGLILWFDRDRMANIIEKTKENDNG